MNAPLKPRVNARLRDISDGYRAASDCYAAACKYGVTGDAEAAIWAIVESWGVAAQADDVDAIRG